MHITDLTWDFCWAKQLEDGIFTIEHCNHLGSSSKVIGNFSNNGHVVILNHRRQMEGRKGNNSGGHLERKEGARSVVVPETHSHLSEKRRLQFFLIYCGSLWKFSTDWIGIPTTTIIGLGLLIASRDKSDKSTCGATGISFFSHIFLQ